MNKDEALWVAIRAVGLVFLVLSIISFAKILSSISYLIYAVDVIGASSGAEVARKTAKSLVLKNASDSLLYVISAYYFMRKGGYVHGVLSK